MTGRWITVGLCALALAGCNKKEGEKPPPPKPEAPATPPATPPTTATTPTTTAPTPTTETPAAPATDAVPTEPVPPTPGVTPTTTPDAPATFVPVKPIRVIPRPLVRLPPGKIQAAKSKAQLKAEKDVLGLWTEQKRRNAILNFTVDGAVSYREKITDKPKWTGRWRADPEGVVQFGLAMQGADSSLQFSAYPTAANIMAVAPHWTKEWGGSGQYAYERLK